MSTYLIRVLGWRYVYKILQHRTTSYSKLWRRSKGVAGISIQIITEFAVRLMLT